MTHSSVTIQITPQSQPAVPPWKAFYEGLQPFVEPFMALFGRNQLPNRSTLSSFLAALDQPTVEALRTLFQKDLLACKSFSSLGGLVDRTGGYGGPDF